jgi:hypothetical protein
MDQRIKDFAVFAGRVLARRWHTSLKEKARDRRMRQASSGGVEKPSTTPTAPH